MRLLAEHRGYRNIGDLPRLKVSQILEWADAFQAQTGRWPTMRSGPVAGTSTETWHRLDSALRRGARGFARPHFAPPAAGQISWGAESNQSAALDRGIDLALGQAPSPPDGSLAERSVWGRRGRPRRNLAADRSFPAGRGAGFAGRFLAGPACSLNTAACAISGACLPTPWSRFFGGPTHTTGGPGSGPRGTWERSPSAGETWRAVQAALNRGQRGLHGGSSVPRLLAEHRGVRHPQDKMRFTLAQIRAWAAAHLKRTGQWPTPVAEPIPEAPEETWQRVNGALREGRRGLRGGSSLFRLCPRHCRNGQHPTDRKQSR